MFSKYYINFKFKYLVGKLNNIFWKFKFIVNDLMFKQYITKYFGTFRFYYYIFNKSHAVNDYQ